MVHSVLLTAGDSVARMRNSLMRSAELGEVFSTSRLNVFVMIDEQKIQRGREILMKYTDPKLKYDGFTAWEIAKLIQEA